MMKGDDDAVLVRRFKDGDEGAFASLFKKYQLALYSICYRQTRNEEDAQELTQEIFIKVYRNLKKFKENSRFFTWLYRIAVNTCISFKRKSHPEIGIRDIQPNPTERDISLKKAIDDALMKLPARQRMAFILRHYEGYKFDEIGQMMGISEGAAKANHFQAIRKLRILLKDWL